MLYPRKVTKGVSRKYLDSRASFIIKAHGKLGLYAWTPSVLDMDLGLAKIQRLAKQAGIRLLASNVVSGEKTAGMERVLKTRAGGLSIGLVGLVGKREKIPDGITIQDPVKTTRDMVKKLKAPSDPVDMVIVLSNMGTKKDQQLAQKVEGIDFIIGAGDDRMIIIPRKINNTLIFQPYKQGEYLGLIHLKIKHLPVDQLVNELEILRTKRKLQNQEGEKTALESRLETYKGANVFRAALHPLSSDIKDDPVMTKMIEDQLSLEAALP